MRILVTGASGYIGGRLVPKLLEGGHDVRCLTRDKRKLNADSWHESVEIVEGDVLDPEIIEKALEDCDAAFYLIHSMEHGQDDFAIRDKSAATSFRRAADAASLRHVVYLGGLGEGNSMSKHLASRQEVGAILARGSTPVTELRAAVIIGSGSVSFEMLRYLTEVLPIMITPTWVRTECQPISVGDVLQILSRTVERVPQRSQIHEIGGPDRLTYQEMMRIYGEEAGLARRRIIPVPILSPRLSSHWIGLVTPLPTAVAKPLVESLKVEVTVGDNGWATRLAGPLIGYRHAVRFAIQRHSSSQVATRWSDSSVNPARPLPRDPDWSGGTVMFDRQLVDSTAQPSDLFWAYSRIGGNVGYYSMNWAWSIRGLLDSLVGGAGRRRGRRDPEQISVGETIDFWRVVDVKRDRSLELSAEMRLPGEAWLSFVAEETETGSTLTQTATFVPRGLFGRVYWWALLPIHAAIFRMMAKRIVATAEQRADTNLGISLEVSEVDVGAPGRGDRPPS